MGTYQKAADLQKKLHPSVIKHHVASHRKRFVIVLAAIVVLGAAGYFADKVINKPTASKQQTDAALVEANKTGNTDTTIAKLQQAYDDAASAEGKAQAGYYLASHYATKADHKNALKYFRAADDYYQGKNIDVVLGVANEAYALTNKSVARTYYQKAVDYYKPLVGDNPTYQDLVNRFETRLKELAK